MDQLLAIQVFVVFEVNLKIISHIERADIDIDNCMVQKGCRSSSKVTVTFLNLQYKYFDGLTHASSGGKPEREDNRQMHVPPTSYEADNYMETKHILFCSYLSRDSYFVIIRTISVLAGSICCSPQ